LLPGEHSDADVA